MKQSLAIVLIFMIALGTVSAGTWTERIPEYPNAPNKCLVELSVGDVYYKAGDCTRYTCGTSSEAGFMEIDAASCGSVRGPEECSLSGEDNTKVYPHCCPQIVCPNAL